jgi:hypothetical protein
MQFRQPGRLVAIAEKHFAESTTDLMWDCRIRAIEGVSE